jgi:hypothetical protein
MAVNKPPVRCAKQYYMPIGELEDEWGENTCHAFFDEILAGNFDNLGIKDGILFLPSWRQGQEYKVDDKVIRVSIAQFITTTQSSQYELDQQVRIPKEDAELNKLVSGLCALGHDRYQLKEQIWVHYRIATEFSKVSKIKLPRYWEPCAASQKKKRWLSIRKLLKDYVDKGGTLPAYREVDELLQRELGFKVGEEQLRKWMKESGGSLRGGRPARGQTQRLRAEFLDFLHSEDLSIH